MRAIVVTTTLSILFAAAGCGGTTPSKADPEKAATELKALQELRQKEAKSGK